MNKIPAKLKRIFLESAIWHTLGIASILLGLIPIIAYFLSKDTKLLLTGITYIALGIAYLIAGKEKMTELMLDSIYKLVHLDDIKKTDRYTLLRFLIEFAGIILFFGATIMQFLIVKGTIAIEKNDLALTLLTISFALATLSRLHGNEEKYKEIYNNTYNTLSDVALLVKSKNKVIKQQKAEIAEISKRKNVNNPKVKDKKWKKLRVYKR
jgi:hypothetical protein